MYRSLSPQHLSPYEVSETDLILAGLRKEIAELESYETDFVKLNDYLAEIESHFVLLLDEKDRVQKDFRAKAQISQQQVDEVEKSIQSTQISFDRISSDFQLATRDNQTIRRCTSEKIGEVQAHQQAISHLTRTTQSFQDKNKQMLCHLKELKENRIKKSKDTDDIAEQLDIMTKQTRDKQRQGRKIQVNISQLIKINQKIENEHNRMNVVLRDRLLELKRVKQRLEDSQILGQSQHFKLKELLKTNQQFIKEQNNIADSLNKATLKNRNLLSKLKVVESNINTNEVKIIEEAKKNKENEDYKKKCTAKNSKLKIDIDLHLAEMKKLENKQNEMQKILTVSQHIDKQAIEMLQSRLEPIGELLKESTNKLIDTGDRLR